MSIEDTLKERGKKYGTFVGHSYITQNIKKAMKDSPQWSVLSNDKTEALEMIAHKVGRILNGDPNYHDSWHDIVGYAKLVADDLAPLGRPATIKEVIKDLESKPKKQYAE